MSSAGLDHLAATVQYNCDISDARHGADYSLCIYLMKMREYFRWEKHLPFGAPLAREQVGEWLQARERLWEQLEEAELRPLEIDGERFDPFDADAINARLSDRGLVYSGGIGNQAKPHFVLGDLEQHQRIGGHSVFVVADEHARDLTAPPAMTQGRSIFVRRESLRRLLWERLEGWRWNRPDNALGRAFACYAFEDDLDGALDAMTEREIRALLLHEEGEISAGERLGDLWNPMLMDLAHHPAEIVARAVRDHLADCLVTLPALADPEEQASLHFFMGNLTNMRKHLFPGLQQTYLAWLATPRPALVQEIASRGRAHWEQVAQQILAYYQDEGSAAASAIRDLAERERL